MIKAKKALVFFGNDQFTLNSLKEAPHSHYLLHQVHGNEILRCQSGEKKADGHWTDHRGQILLIKTADCLPVFIADDRRIMALHMGWRAFTHNLFDRAMEYFDWNSRTHIFVGPHIGYSSFQVDDLNAKRILDYQKVSLNRARQQNWLRPSRTQKNHCYIDLLGLLKNWAHRYKLNSITSYDVDTFRSPMHYSHRRNRWRKGTNYSFIVKP